MKRTEIKTLKKAGLSNARIAEIADVALRSVERIAKEPHKQPDVVDESPTRSVGRPSKVDEFAAVVQDILKATPDLPTVEVLHRVRAKGYVGGKSALYGLVARVRTPPAASPMVRFEGLAGEFSQNDFGHVDVEYLDGGKERIHFFVARLKYSRWSFVRLVPDETVESLVRALLLSFESFGGVPLVCVFDNPKTVVIRRRENRIEWNKTFGQMALDFRFAPELCAPARGNQKGSVENLVGWVKGSFFKVRRFQDREDRDSQLVEWLSEGNTQRKSRATGIIPLVRMEEERPRLRPMSVAARDYALKFPIMVGPTGLVEHKGIRYAMPPRSIGFPGTLHLFEDRVVIVARAYKESHPRFPENGKTSYLPEQRAEHLAKISGERGRLYFKRQQVLDLGKDAEALLTEIVHRHPRTWTAEVEILFGLLQQFGESRLRRALRIAVDRRQYEADSVARIVRKVI